MTPENGLSSNGIAKTDNVLGRQERANSVAIDSGILGGMPLSHRCSRKLSYRRTEAHVAIFVNANEILQNCNI